MSKARNTIFTKFIVIATLVLLMVAQHPGTLSSAEAVKATTAVKHKPLKYFVAWHRIQVEAKVTDIQGVSLVRCYFRAAGQSDYVFVGMKAGRKDAFTGILPAPAAETKGIEYLFLTVNGKNQVVKTQVFKTERKDIREVSYWDKVTDAATSLVSKKPTSDVPTWQQVSSEGHVVVSTELPETEAPEGFADSIVFDVVESSVRFGYVVGIYSAAQAAGGVAAAGGTTGAATAATSGGTVSASSGLSTTVIVGASAAVVAVAGVAVATGGGGDDGDGAAGCGKYEGNWVEEPTFLGLRMTIGSDCSASLCGGCCTHSTVVEDTVSFQDCSSPAVVNCKFNSSTSVSCTVPGMFDFSMKKQ